MTFCFILKLKTTLFYFLLFVFIRCTNPCHWLSLIVTCYHSLSFIVTRCHSFSLDLSPHCHSLSRVAIRCTSRCHLLYHSLPFAVTCCTTRCHSFSLDVSIICLFINDHNNVWKKIWQHILMIFFQVFHYSIYLLVGK